MISHPEGRAQFESPRWKAVRLGLRLANSYLGVAALGLYYALWVVIGLALCLVLIPFAVSGKMDAFNKAMNPVALYGFLVPLAFLAAITWAIKLFSRFLWCAIPEPLTATLIAFVSVAGRLSVVAGAGYLWAWGGPYGQGLLRSEVVSCSAVAWVALLADWAFIRTLQREFLPDESSARLAGESEVPMEIASKERVTEPIKQSIFTRHIDPGAWFKSRFPRAHKFVAWILAPIAYVTLSSLADNGDPQVIPRAIFKLAVVGPAFLQAIWVPSRERLTELLSSADKWPGPISRI